MAINMAALRRMARKLNAKIEKNDNKTTIIRKIQLSEGNFDCYRRSQGFCDQMNCAWRGDCLGTKA